MNNGGIFHGAAQGFAQSSKIWGGGGERKIYWYWYTDFHLKVHKREKFFVSDFEFFTIL